MTEKEDIDINQLIDESAEATKELWLEALSGDDESDMDKSLWPDYVHREKKVQELAQDVTEDCDQCIRDAFDQQIWPDGVNKSPTWEDDDDVTQETQQWVEAIFDMRDPLYDAYSGIPQAAALRVKSVIQESLTQPQGWSLDSVVGELEDEFEFMERSDAKRIARQEISATLNHAEAVSLKARSEEPIVRWVGPDDNDTTELCQEVKSEVGDGVPVSELEKILEEKSRKYEYGTPERVDQFLPHWLCRHRIEEV